MAIGDAFDNDYDGNDDNDDNDDMRGTLVT